LVAEGSAATLCREGSRLGEIEAIGRGTFHEHRTERILAAALEAGAQAKDIIFGKGGRGSDSSRTRSASVSAGFVDHKRVDFGKQLQGLM
jgi:hypothetical protein